MKYALFAFGSYYPNGGFDDLRGLFDSIPECRNAFKEVLPKLMSEQGYGESAKPTKCHGQIVDLKEMKIVETLSEC